MSHAGDLNIGVISCRETMPDVDSLVQRLPDELAHLEKLAVD